MNDFVLRPLTKEVLLFLIHYDTRDENLTTIISEKLNQFRKLYVKRLDYLKKQVDEEDWELINTNNAFISYII